jgi:hypothetical protein
MQSHNNYHLVEVVDEQTVFNLRRQVNNLMNEKESTQRFLNTKKEAHLKMRNNFLNEISRKL